MIIILKIFVFILSLFLVAVMDWSAEKDKAKDQKKYSFKEDYWPERNDNVLVLLLKSFLTGVLGFFVSSEALGYFFPALENIPMTDVGIDIILIIAFTVGSGSIFKKFGS